MSVSWQWAKANPDAAARRIRELERENAELRSMLREAIMSVAQHRAALAKEAKP